MDKPRPEAAPAELGAAKSAYVAALRRRPQYLSGATSASRRQEYEFYLKRLRYRLKTLGLRASEVEDLESAEAARIVEGAPPAPTASTLSRARTAILVVHGIGEQNPYETLDQFSRNLTRYLRFEGEIDDLTVSAQKIDHNDRVEAMVRLETARHGPPTEEGQASAYIDLYEYYWAPETEDKISFRQTISWLIKTTLTPIRMLDQNVRLIEGEPDAAGMTRGAIFARELWRICLIYLPVLAFLALLLAWLPSAFNISDVVKATAQEWNADHPTVRALMTAMFVAAAVLFWVVLKQLCAKWLRWLRQETVRLDSNITLNTSIAAAVVAGAGTGIGALFKVDIVQYFRPLLNAHLAIALAAAALARAGQLFLEKFVGDVAVYVNVDAKAKNFAVRRTVLNGATTALTRILKDSGRAYEQVIVAGHSLGSVIAYDSLNELLNRCRSAPPADGALYATPDQLVGTVPGTAEVSRGDLARITGLVTFGSPLDKVHYFFRDFVPEEQSVRAQLISLLRSFRSRSSGSDYGIYRFTPYTADQLGNIKWLNAWSRQDPVSGMLHFYTSVTRQQFDYLIPIYAHLSYWEDLRFYAFFADPLLLGRPEGATPIRGKIAVA